MRILWFSNAPWGKGGYANQTRLAVEHLTKLGHKVAVACNFGLRGGKLGSEDGVMFYPQGYDTDSNDIVQGHADDFKADVIVSLYDAWPLKFAKLKTPWVAWVPVDHQTAPAEVVEALKPALKSVSFSQHGEIELQKAGLDAAYIPLGVDTNVFKPMDKQAARERLGLPTDKFVVGMVGANVGFPNRKCIPQALYAFAKFHKAHPDSVFYLHTEELGISRGVRIKPLLRSLDLEPGAVLLCDQYHYLTGFPEDYMVDVFNGIDVLMSPSMGEGYGIPIMEAQACGTPVIATDFTSMPELVSGGWVITEYEPWWSAQGAWQALPRVGAIEDTLENARASLNHMRDYNSHKARVKALEYDFETVVAPMWDELLKGLPL